MKIDDLQKIAKLDLHGINQEELPQTHQRMQELLLLAGLDPSNLYQELEMSSPYVNTHRDVTYGPHMVSLHSHSYAELLYCREVSGVEYLVGPDRYSLRRGDVIFVPPGVSHRPVLSEQMETPYVRDVIWISTDFLQKISQIHGYEEEDHRNNLILFRTAGTKWEFLGDLFDRGIREEEAQSPGWETAVIGNTLLIITYLQRIYLSRSVEKIKAEKLELLGRVTAYIEEHYSEPINVSDLSKHCYVSASTISHLFKQKMGVGVYRHITQRRLIAAKILIENGTPLEQVSQSVGFADYSSFYRAFRQEYGISSRQYRGLLETAGKNPR